MSRTLQSTAHAAQVAFNGCDSLWDKSTYMNSFSGFLLKHKVQVYSYIFHIDERFKADLHFSLDFFFSSKQFLNTLKAAL